MAPPFCLAIRNRELHDPRNERPDKDQGDWLLFEENRAWFFLGNDTEAVAASARPLLRREPVAQ